VLRNRISKIAIKFPLPLDPVAADVSLLHLIRADSRRLNNYDDRSKPGHGGAKEQSFPAGNRPNDKNQYANLLPSGGSPVLMFLLHQIRFLGRSSRDEYRIIRLRLDSTNCPNLCKPVVVQHPSQRLGVSRWSADMLAALARLRRKVWGRFFAGDPGRRSRTRFARIASPALFTGGAGAL
jgi:hypothetical protein